MEHDEDQRHHDERTRQLADRVARVREQVARLRAEPADGEPPPVGTLPATGVEQDRATTHR